MVIPSFRYDVAAFIWQAIMPFAKYRAIRWSVWCLKCLGQGLYHMVGAVSSIGSSIAHEIRIPSCDLYCDRLRCCASCIIAFICCAQPVIPTCVATIIVHFAPFHNLNCGNSLAARWGDCLRYAVEIVFNYMSRFTELGVQLSNYAVYAIVVNISL